MAGVLIKACSSIRLRALAIVIAFVSQLAGCGRPDSSDVAAGSKQPTVEEGYFPGADGVQLFYRRVGTGDEIAVYLHGGPVSMSDGGYELDALAQRRTLIAFDQRSGGRSQLLGDPSHLTVDYYVRDLEALQKHFGLTRFTLIGQSWGAMLAAMFASRHPDAVERLLLLSPGPPAQKYWSSRIERTNAVIGAEGVARIGALAKEIVSAPDDRVAALCNERVELIFRAYLKDVSALQRMRVGHCDGAPAALRHETTAGDYLYPSLGDYDLTPDLAKLTQPALVVEGAGTKVPLEATRAWAAALPNGRLLLIPRASHIVWLEGDIARTMTLLNQFLDGSWPAGSEVVRR